MVFALISLPCLTGPLMVKEAKARIKRESEDIETIYVETSVIAVLLALIWPIVVGVFVIIWVLRGMGATMKLAVRLSSKE